MKNTCLLFVLMVCLFGTTFCPVTVGDVSGAVGPVTVKDGYISQLSNGQNTVSFPGGLKFRLQEKDPLLPLVEAKLTIIETTGNVTRLAGNFTGSDLKLEIQLTDEKDHFSVKGILSGAADKERMIDLFLAAPVPPTHEWRMWKNWREFAWLPASTTSDVIEYDSVFPMLAADHGDNDNNEGFAIAAHPRYPVRFLAGCTGEETWVRLALGLSPGNKKRNAAEFQMVIFPYEGKSGMRSAIAGFYNLFPDLFSNKFTRLGGWYVAPLGQLKLDPRYLAFHEAGLGLFMKEGLKPKATHFTEYTSVDGLDRDIENDKYFFPYIVPGQRQIFPVHVKAKSGVEAETILNSWSSDKPITFENLANATSFNSPQELKNIIINSGLRDRRGNPVFVNREITNDKIPTLTFPQNADPDLFYDSDRPTVGKYMDGYLNKFLKEVPQIAGFYIDSLGIWGKFYNHRVDHRRYADFAPSYDPKDGGVALPNQFSMAEFLWHLQDQLRRQGKYIFGNGLRPNRAFCSFPCDIIGLELSEIKLTRPAFYSPRLFAGRKPVLILAKGQVSEDFFQKALFMGYIVSGGAPVAPLFKKYAPAMIEIAQASWEPRVDATSSDSSVWVEKWSSDHNTRYYTLLNTSNHTVNTTLTFSGRSSQIKSIGVLLDSPIPEYQEKPEGWITARLKMSAGECAALKVEFNEK